MRLIPHFNSDKLPDMTGWYFFENAFTPEELDDINEMIIPIPYVAATIANNTGQKEMRKYRKSNIKWISATDDFNNSFHRHHWLYDRLMECITEANDVMWNFDLHGLTDSIQYTEYDGTEEGFYGWHVDIGPRELALRKVSLVVQLSDPSEYEGGELHLKTGSGETTTPNMRGTVIVFPSYLLHRVTPVTSGLRKSLVLWAGGSRLK